METPICIDMKEEPTAVVEAQQSHHRLFRRLRDGTKRDEFRWKSRDGYHKYARKTWTWKYTVYKQSYKLYSRPLNGLVSRQKLTWKNTTKLLAKENVIPRSRSKIFDFWEAKWVLPNDQSIEVLEYNVVFVSSGALYLCGYPKVSLFCFMWWKSWRHMTCCYCTCTIVYSSWHKSNIINYTLYFIKGS